MARIIHPDSQTALHWTDRAAGAVLHAPAGWVNDEARVRLCCPESASSGMCCHAPGCLMCWLGVLQTVHMQHHSACWPQTGAGWWCAALLEVAAACAASTVSLAVSPVSAAAAVTGQAVEHGVSINALQCVPAGSCSSCPGKPQQVVRYMPAHLPGIPGCGASGCTQAAALEHTSAPRPQPCAWRTLSMGTSARPSGRPS